MINTREIAEEYRLAHWAQIMHERIQSGLSIKAYCKQIGICGNTYFYWQRRVRAAAYERVTRTGNEAISTGLVPKGFAEVKLSGPTGGLPLSEAASSGCLRVEVGRVRIMVNNAYPSAQLAELLNGIMQLC